MPRAKYHYLQKYALRMLTAAKQRGDLVPAERCQKCGCPSEGRALDGHHEDYSKPLEVIWLCRSCHKELHQEHEYRLPSRMKNSSKSQTDFCVEHFKKHPEDKKVPGREMSEKYPMPDGYKISYVTWNKAKKL